jgi:hypothetical protein
MTTIRPDAPERLSESLTLLTLIRDASAPELRKQHLDRLQRLLEMLADSVEQSEG